MIYIMIIFSFIKYNGVSISTHSVEFKTKESCITAAKLIKEKTQNAYSIDIFCVEKGDFQ